MFQSFTGKKKEMPFLYTSIFFFTLRNVYFLKSIKNLFYITNKFFTEILIHILSLEIMKIFKPTRNKIGE